MAVAIEVDRVVQVARGHELRLSHGPRPRAGHRGGVDVAAVDHHQRVIELIAEERAAAWLPGQGGQGTEDRRPSAGAAEPALEAPDGEDEAALDVIGRFDP